MGRYAEADDEGRSDCLHTAQIQALVDGRLEGEALARAEAHLHSCPLCLGIVADAAHGADSGERLSQEKGGSAMPLASKPPGVPLLADGTLIGGKYQIEKLLKHGGMGSVFAARHVDLGHRVTIKILRCDGAQAAARFMREAQICASFVSDRIVRVSDFGKLPDGTPYLVMEYLVGRDLGQVIADGRVSVDATVRYLIEACEGLREAHAAGVVHRDLKPGNLFLVERSGQRSSIKLLDFGISKTMTPEVVDTALRLTSTGMVIGSPLYMSPEQIRGVREIDARTDIWSLGVILYELLTGQQPFRAPNISALAIAIATDPCPLPSSVRPDLPLGLDDLVVRCLAKEPAQRFESVEALERALRALAGSYSGDATQCGEAVSLRTSLNAPEATPHIDGKAQTVRRWRAIVLVGGASALMASAWWSTRDHGSLATDRKHPPAAATPHLTPPPPTFVPSSIPPAGEVRVQTQPEAALPDGGTPSRPARRRVEKPPSRARRGETPSSVTSTPARPVGPLDTPD